MVEVTEILTHWYAGRAISEIARSLGVDRKTVRKYLAPALAAGLVPGGPPIAQEQWLAWVREWFPDVVRIVANSDASNEVARFQDRIAEGLKTNTLSTVWQRLRDEDGLGASLSTTRRYVHAAMPQLLDPTAVTVFKEDAGPGEEGQVDYGYLGPWVDPLSGKRHRVWGFLIVLGHSRHQFLRPVLRMTLAVWLECHVAAFQFFGGVPFRLVVDNLRAGVLRPDLYDRTINRSYAELAVHYGTLVDPARAAHPKDKPKVERMVPYARDSFFAGRGFASHDQMVDGAVTWSSETAGGRHCRSLGGAHPHDVFLAREQAALLPLPTHPFEMVEWATPTVAPDCRTTVLGAQYTVPWQYIGRPPRRARLGDHGRVLPRWPRGQNPRSGTSGRALHRLVRLPAGQDRLPAADARLVPATGGRDGALGGRRGR